MNNPHQLQQIKWLLILMFILNCITTGVLVLMAVDWNTL